MTCIELSKTAYRWTPAIQMSKMIRRHRNYVIYGHKCSLDKFPKQACPTIGYAKYYWQFHDTFTRENA